MLGTIVKMTNANYELAKERAEALWETSPIKDPPVRVHELAASMQLNIQEARFPAPYDTKIQGYLDWANKVIVLNAEDSTNRKRFTIAHELGHVQLHQSELENDPDLGVMYRQNLKETNPDYREREANCFAASLLMPVPLVLRYFKRVSLHDLATLFMVSDEAMSYRLEGLRRDGLI